MPIKNLSNQRRMPRLGKIHLGVKVEKKNDRGEVISTYPKAVDYFVCPPEVQAVYGQNPKELNIMFPVEDPAKFAPHYYKLYSSFRGLVCKGDGTRCVRLVDTATGDFAHRDTKVTAMAEMTCDGRDCPQYKETKCKELMMLQFFLPNVPGLGVYQLDTTSYHSIVAVNSAVAYEDAETKTPAGIVRGICNRVSMIPLILSIEPQPAQIAGVNKTIHCLHIRSDVTLAAIQKLGAIPGSQVLLPQPDEEKPDLLFADDEETAPVMQSEPAAPQPEKKAVEAPAPVIIPAKRDPAAIRNLGDLFTACLKDFRMSRSDVLRELNVNSAQAISITPAECYQAVAEIKAGA